MDVLLANRYLFIYLLFIYVAFAGLFSVPCLVRDMCLATLDCVNGSMVTVKYHMIVSYIFQSQKLRDENLILKKNISSLYLTAREEIKRKDAQIKTLQDREVRSRRKYAASQQ